MKKAVCIVLVLAIVLAGVYIGANDYITREEFCLLVQSVYKKSDAITKFDVLKNPFDDTKSYAVLYLYNCGVINGKSESRFCPEEYITDEEAVIIAKRIYVDICEKKGMDYITTQMDYKGDVSPWAREDIGYAYNMGLIFQGFEAKSSMTVAEAEELVDRLAANTARSVLTFDDRLNGQMNENENYMFSPYGIKMALALAANGGNDEVKNEILALLGAESTEVLNERAQSDMARLNGGKELVFNAANSIWVNRSEVNGDFRKSFSNIAEKYYNAKVGEVTGGDAADKINGWVSEKTNGRIQGIVNENPSFAAAIINAVYFKGAWANDFNERATQKGVFHNADGKDIQTDFMHRTGDYRIGANMIELPFKREGENSFSMFVIVGDGVNVRAAIDGAQLAKARVRLSMPKFKMEYSKSLKEVLDVMGMKQSFVSGFDNILTGDMCFIDDVLHKTYINVDEKGAEAAAVTGIMVGATSAPAEIIDFVIDKPFYFAIRDNVTGEIMFMGRYANAQ